MGSSGELWGARGALGSFGELWEAFLGGLEKGVIL